MRAAFIGTVALTLALVFFGALFMSVQNEAIRQLRADKERLERMLVSKEHAQECYQK